MPFWRDEKTRCLLSWAAVAAYAAYVGYMSLRPFGDSGLDRAIDRVGRAYFHIPAYAGLAALLALALPAGASPGRRARLSFLIATAYGWALEVAQIPAPTRSFNLRGLLFDALGAAAGAAAAFLFFAWRKHGGRLPWEGRPSS
jgi:VanZ family protein